MKPFIKNEYGKLRGVVVSSLEYYDPDNFVINNITNKYYADKGQIPEKEKMLKEQQNFWKALESFGVNVLVADQVEGAKGQVYTRDLGFVIGDKFFISSMAKENRRSAIDGWRKILNDFPRDKIVKVPEKFYLEGGDVVVDAEDVYVGLSERTTKQGVDFLREKLGDEYNVIPIQLKKDFLHLDVVFTVINPNLAIVYKDGIEEESYEKLNKFDKIELDSVEQFSLGTNVFVVDPQTVVVQSQHQRLAGEIKKRGLDVVNVDLSETSKDGGALRCTTCPIEREM